MFQYDMIPTINKPTHVTGNTTTTINYIYYKHCSK